MIFGLTDKVAAMIGGGVSIVAIGVSVFLFFEKESYRKAIEDPETGYQVRLETAQRNLGTCQANTATLEIEIREQNAAIEEAGERSAGRLDGLQRQLDRAEGDLARAQRRAAEILQVDPGQADRCAAALELIQGEGE